MHRRFFGVKSVAEFLAAASFLFPLCGVLGAQEKAAAQSTNSESIQAASRAGLPDALPPEQWARVEQAVDRALAWLASQQQAGGAFPSAENGQPAVTSLGILAFLSRGHQPGVGPYGQQLNRAIDFVLKSQRPNGLLTYGYIEPSYMQMGASHTSTYNHAIAGLMLAEVFGSVTGDRAKRIKQAIEKALEFTRQMQREPAKEYPEDEGGWRYVIKFYGLNPHPSSSDLSVTGWHLMFLRSAKNAEFKVPNEVVESAIGYVERCFNPKTGLFQYIVQGNQRRDSRGMMGAGILSLSLGGKHQTEIARRAGDWLLANPFSVYGEQVGKDDRFHYGAYYCSQAMAQLGGHYWKGFFPPLVKTFLQNQASDGAWPAESGKDEMFGRTYTTSLSVLTLTPPFQLLPIYQR